MLAFRMLTKDLLVLFQAGNEGIINLLGASLAQQQTHEKTAC